MADSPNARTITVDYQIERLQAEERRHNGTEPTNDTSEAFNVFVLCLSAFLTLAVAYVVNEAPWPAQIARHAPSSTRVLGVNAEALLEAQTSMGLTTRR